MCEVLSKCLVVSIGFGLSEDMVLTLHWATSKYCTPTSMSFLSVEPESKSLLESHTDTLLAQFDVQLNIVTDRYLAFFQERSVHIAQILHFTLSVWSSGEVLRQPSQLLCEKNRICYLSWPIPLKYRFFAKTLSQGRDRLCWTNNDESSVG